MKKLNLEQLKPDPLASALHETEFETIIVSGYIICAHKNTISLAKNQLSRSFCEYPREAIVAAFKNSEKSEKVTLIIKKDILIRHVSYSKVNEKACGCPDENIPGVKEARPLKSIHAALAELQTEINRIKSSVGTGPGSVFLSCGEKFSDCMRKTGDLENCRFEEDICIHHGTFG